MNLLYEFRRRAWHVIVPAVAMCALIYMGFHIVHGDSGLLAWRAHKDRIAQAREELAEIEAERRTLQHHVSLLHPQSLDRDMVDEWARRMLNFAHPEETVIFIDGADGPPR
jgi:cell division protein FtsB